MTTAAPRGTYLARDPAGWLYGGTDNDNPNHRATMRTELDARIRTYQSQHPEVTSRAGAEHALRTADRHRAQTFLTRLKRHGLAALIGGPPGPKPVLFTPDTPAGAIPLCSVCGAHALLAIHEAARGVCETCRPSVNGHRQRNGDRDTA